MTLLQIIRHCQESLPEMCSGELLGLDRENSLEVTHSFPALPLTASGTDDGNNNASTYVSRADARDPYRSIIELSTTPGDTPGASYAASRCEHLRDANVDSLCVGWYVSAHLGAWVTETTLQAQFEHQQECPGAVVVVYDPPRSTQGSLSVQAYRLTEEFMALYETKRFTLDALREAGVGANDILTRVPVRLVASHLAQATLISLAAMTGTDGVSPFSCDSERLTFGAHPYLEKGMETLVDTLDDMHQRHGSLQHYYRNAERQRQQLAQQLARRRARNAELRAMGEPEVPEDDLLALRPPSEPSRLDTLILASQVGSHCQQLNEFAGQSFSRHFLASKFLQQPGA